MPTSEVDYLFEAKEPGVKDIYNHLLTSLKKLGPVKKAAKKSSIHLENKLLKAARFDWGDEEAS